MNTKNDHAAQQKYGHIPNYDVKGKNEKKKKKNIRLFFAS